MFQALGVRGCSGGRGGWEEVRERERGGWRFWEVGEEVGEDYEVVGEGFEVFDLGRVRRDR